MYSLLDGIKPEKEKYPEYRCIECTLMRVHGPNQRCKECEDNMLKGAWKDLTPPPPHYP